MSPKIRKALRQQFDGSMTEVLQARDRVLRSDDAEALHDFRVALRSLRSLLAPCKKGLPGKGKLKRIDTGLKRYADETNAMRDTEVSRMWLMRLAPQLAPSIETERQLLLTLQAGLNEHQLDRQLRRLGKILASGLKRFGKQRLLRRYLKEAGQMQQKMLLQVLQELAPDSSDMEAMHGARLLTKRVRYQSAAFGRLLDSRSTRLEKPLKQLQDVLGDMRDLDNLLQQLAGQEGIAALQTERIRIQQRLLPGKWKNARVALHKTVG